MTLQQVYRCAIDPELFAAKIEEAEKLSDDLNKGTVFVPTDVWNAQLINLAGWGIHLTQVATRCCGRAKASTKKRIPRLLLWRGVGLRSASDSRSCRPKAATAMNSRVGRLGGHSHDSRNLTFLFRSREATTHRVYLNEVDTPLWLNGGGKTRRTRTNNKPNTPVR